MLWHGVAYLALFVLDLWSLGKLVIFFRDAFTIVFDHFANTDPPKH